MKKKIGLVVLLITVAGMAFAGDPLEQVKILYGNLKPRDIDDAVRYFEQAQELMGKISTGMECYKLTKSMVEISKYASKYKDSSSESDKRNATRAASKSILNMLDVFVNVAGGPVYGQIVPVLLKQADNAVEALNLHKADIQFHDYVTNYNNDVKGPGNPGPLNPCAGWNWYSIYSNGYEPLAKEILAKGVKTSLKRADDVMKLEFITILEIIRPLELAKAATQK